MENVTNLRQAETSIKVSGILAEKKMEIKEENGEKSVSGYLTVKTDDTNFIRINVKKTGQFKKGTTTENGFWAGLMTVMNEFKSIADVGAEQADKVYVSNTRDGLNLYRNKTSGKTVTACSSASFNRSAPDKYEPMAEYEVELFIKSIVPEVVNEEETGRILVHGWVPTYNGIEPIVLVGDGEIGSAVESMYEPGQTVRFFGDIINSKVEIIKEIPVAIGKPRVEKKTEYKNELVITGASPAYEDEVAYNADAIKKAIQERENKIAEEAAQQNTPTPATKPSAAARGRIANF